MAAFTFEQISKTEVADKVTFKLKAASEDVPNKTFDIPIEQQQHNSFDVKYLYSLGHTSIDTMQDWLDTHYKHLPRLSQQPFKVKTTQIDRPRNYKERKGLLIDPLLYLPNGELQTRDRTTINFDQVTSFATANVPIPAGSNKLEYYLSTPPQHAIMIIAKYVRIDDASIRRLSLHERVQIADWLYGMCNACTWSWYTYDQFCHVAFDTYVTCSDDNVMKYWQDYIDVVNNKG